MSFEVKTIGVFERQAKRLSKKYPSLKEELLSLIQNLKENPKQGTAIGMDCYKIRLAIRSKNKGKSGGARVITNIVVRNKTVYLLAVYDESDRNNLTNKELKELLQSLPE